jgi:lincosamide nucleotidyltransferase A/C/D/E
MSERSTSLWLHGGLCAVYRVIRVMYRVIARSPAGPLLRVPVVERVHRRMTAPRVTCSDVVEIVRELSAAKVRMWLMGGWGCDALLGEQTRKHADLDLVIPETEERCAVQTLERLGFAVRTRFNSKLLNVAVELIDPRRRRKVALHFVDIDSRGGDGWRTSLSAPMRVIGLDSHELFATGRVSGHPLPCLSAPMQLLLHTGYEPGDDDRRDVSLLCSRFSLPPPPGYGTPAARPGE